MDLQDNKGIRAHIFGLTVSCPYSSDNPTDCPLHEIRELPLLERKKWSCGLTDEECRNTYEYHIQCLRQKEANLK